MDIHKFEEAYLSAGGKSSELEKEDGEYTSSKAQMGWEMWQVAKAQSLPEAVVLLPVEPTQAIKTALSYQCFDIPKKAENEQSFFLHKFLLLAIKHGDDFIKFFNAETKAMIEAQEQGHD